MKAISREDLFKKISKGETFEPVLVEGAVKIQIKDYQPYICTAIHAGNNLSSDIENNCLLTPDERKVEEDPFTDYFVQPFPITLIGYNSRYEYDLNRSQKNCSPKKAWGRQIWKRRLSENDVRSILDKHELYYQILDFIIKKLQNEFGGCLILDIHSYNWKVRTYEKAPVYNIGTSQINLNRWGKIVNLLEKELSKTKFPNIETTVGRDIVFKGNGYQASFVQKFPSSVVLIPLEIKKVFMDELTGESFPLVLEDMQKNLYRIFLKIFESFSKSLGKYKVTRRNYKLDPLVVKIDRALYTLCKNLETLFYVNPINLKQEYDNFFKKKDYIPQFRYRQLKVDPYNFREKLYALPVSKIINPFLRELYSSVIDKYAMKIDCLTSIGTPEFLYNSLRYYEKPDLTDIKIAYFLLQAPEASKFKNEPKNISAQQVKNAFDKILDQYGIDFKVVLSNKLVAKAMVDNVKKIVFINENFEFKASEVQALIHHEFGVHVLTTVNSLEQPLKVLRLGFPNNIATQEGLAIYSEYLSGNLTVSRLKILAIRVIAINMMVKGQDFASVFNCLIKDYQQSKESAFVIATRIFRGGGYTKDAIYLRGFREIISLVKKQSIEPLFLGKTSIKFLPILRELIESGILYPCKFLPPAYKNKIDSPREIDYLIEALY
jgi:uncharacterized protein (TIGR02421 family)